MKPAPIWIILLLSIVFISCKNSETITYQVGKSRIKYKLSIPSGYSFEGLSSDHAFEKRFWYADSSVVFITTFDNTLNYEDIRNQGFYAAKFRAVHSSDTLTLSGTNPAGFFWKENVLEFVTIGYARVPAAKKATFDKALRSVTKR